MKWSWPQILRPLVCRIDVPALPRIYPLQAVRFTAAFWLTVIIFFKVSANVLRAVLRCV